MKNRFVLFFYCLLFFNLSFVTAQTQKIHFNETIQWRNSSQFPLDTLDVLLNFWVEGDYDTTWDTSMVVDTIEQPVDILLAVDLSNSMRENDGTIKWRISWAQLSAYLFLDKLNPSDRIGVFGWSASENLNPLDTSDQSKYFQTWFPLSTNTTLAGEFIKNNLYIDGIEELSEIQLGNKFIKQNPISGGNFIKSPIHLSLLRAVEYLSPLNSIGSKAVVFITDGENTDHLEFDSLKFQLQKRLGISPLKIFTVGYNGGNPEKLRQIAELGDGNFYQASQPEDLNDILEQIRKILIINRIDSSISISARDIKPYRGRKPVDILLSVDLSNSMKLQDQNGRWRITWAQIAALNIIEELNPEDRISIMGWNSTSQFRNWEDSSGTNNLITRSLPFTRDSSTAVHFIQDSLYLDGSELLSEKYQNHNLVKQNPMPGAYGSTPLNASIILGLKHLQQSRSDAKKVIIVITDGDNRDNIADSLVAMNIQHTSSSEDFNLFTIGYVGGNKITLEEFASLGKGRFYYAQEPESLLGIFESISQIVLKNFALYSPSLNGLIPEGFSLIQNQGQKSGSNNIGSNSFSLGLPPIPYFQPFHLNYTLVKNEEIELTGNMDMLLSNQFIYKAPGGLIDTLNYLPLIDTLGLNNLNLTSLPEKIFEMENGWVKVNQNSLCSLPHDQENWINSHSTDPLWKETQMGNFPDCLNSNQKKWPALDFSWDLSKNHLQLRFKSPLNRTLRIFDLNGSSKHLIQSNQKKLSLNLDFLPKGLYLLEIRGLHDQKRVPFFIK